MRLLSVRLVNFGSHADTTLDLGAIDSVIFTGDTGAGKSTVIAGAEFALWGEVPGGADQAVRLGSTSAAVTTTFAARGAVYRVTRGRKLNGRGSSTLELEVADPACPSGWRSESGANLRDTEKRIETIVGPYDLACATWLARQGETDTFSRLTSGERRAYIGRLLGLDRFARYRDAARDMAKTDEATLDTTRPRRSALEAVVAKRPEYETCLGDARAALDRACADEAAAIETVTRTSESAATLRLEHDGIRAGRARHDAAKTAAATAAETARARVASVHSLADEVKGLESAPAAWTTVDDALLVQARDVERNTAASLDAIRARGEAAADAKRTAEAEVVEADAAIERANAASREEWQRARTAATERVHAAERALDEARVRLDAADRAVRDERRAAAETWTTERSRRQGALSDAEHAAHAAAVEVGEATRAISDARTHAREAWQRDRGAAQTAEARALAAAKAAEVAVESARRDAGLIGEVPCGGSGAFAACKLLTGAMQRRADLPGLESSLADARAALESARHALAGLSDQAPDPALAVLAPLEAARAEAQRRANETAQTQATARAALDDLGTTPPPPAPEILAPLEAALATARAGGEDATHEADRLRRALTAMGTVAPGADPDTLEPLETARDAAKARAAAAATERQRLVTAYQTTEAERHTARTRIADLEARRDAAAESVRRLGEIRGRLDAARTELAREEAEAARLVSERDALVPGAQLGRDLDAETRDAESRVRDATLRRDAAVRSVHLAETEVRDRERLVAEAVQAQADIEALDATTAETRRHLADLTVLAQAYADVPQLIVETVIPDIEETANRLLARISASGIAVSLRTQKVLKSDTTRLAETLDIVVRDSVGERVYERYSGGERFEIDLALRVALTRVLSARAGLDLRTIVIDEGFGSQSQDRIQAIASVLGTIAAMFGLCIVISHVDGLAEAMPHEAHVVKGPGGSVVECVGDWPVSRVDASELFRAA